MFFMSYGLYIVFCGTRKPKSSCKLYFTTSETGITKSAFLYSVFIKKRLIFEESEPSEYILQDIARSLRIVLCFTNKFESIFI